MNAIALNSSFARKRPRGSVSVLQPIDEWSRLRTALVALGLSVLVAVLGVRAWRMSDASRLDASRVAWAAAQAKLQAAGRISAELPGLKARAASDRLWPERWRTADALRAVADLAAQRGLREAVSELAARTGGDPKTPQVLPERIFRLRAEGSFAEIRRFLEALAGLPRLVVPDSVQIRWAGRRARHRGDIARFRNAAGNPSGDRGAACECIIHHRFVRQRGCRHANRRDAARQHVRRFTPRNGVSANRQRCRRIRARAADRSGTARAGGAARGRTRRR